MSLRPSEYLTTRLEEQRVYLTTLTPINHSATPRVTIKNNEAFANSHDVAEFIGKKHFHVLRDIASFEEGPNPDLDAAEFAKLFKVSGYMDGNGQLRPAFDMTKDSFTLLVMGYTGKKAIQFKLRYIEEFNRMEAH